MLGSLLDLDSQETYMPTFGWQRIVEKSRLWLSFIGDPVNRRFDVFVKEPGQNIYTLTKLLMPTFGKDESGIRVLSSYDFAYSSEDMEPIVASLFKLNEERNYGLGLEDKATIGIAEYLGRSDFDQQEIAIIAGSHYKNYRRTFLN